MSTDSPRAQQDRPHALAADDGTAARRCARTAAQPRRLLEAGDAAFAVERRGPRRWMTSHGGRRRIGTLYRH